MTILNDLKNKYQNCSVNNCIEIYSDKCIGIVDPGENDKCYVTTSSESEAHDFTINNINEKEIYFVAIDKCIFFDDTKFKKCDFALFDNTTFSLIEIKKPQSNNRRKKLKEKAVLQIEQTIIEFRSKIDFDSYNFMLEGILCMCWKPARPLRKSSKASKEIEFFDKYKLSLKDGSIKNY